MITPELLAYVSAQKKARVSNDVIRTTLINQGWTAEDVDTALKPNAQAFVAPPQPDGSFANSGSGSQIPPELKKWNWGAAFLTWIWGIRFRVWIAFVVFVPIVSVIWWIVLGIKGSEWAWQASPHKDPARFQREQKAWGLVGFIVFFASVIFTALYIILVFGVGSFSLDKARSNASDAKMQSDIMQLSSALTLYANDNNGVYLPGPDSATSSSQWSPEKIGKLAPTFFSIVPTPSKSNTSYEYRTTSDLKHYVVYTKLITKNSYYAVSDASGPYSTIIAPVCDTTCH